MHQFLYDPSVVIGGEHSSALILNQVIPYLFQEMLRIPQLAEHWLLLKTNDSDKITRLEMSHWSFFPHVF